ncbi:mannose-binding protein c [Plakobranchus ocellatus]|uniref:Mannose-binding protein c n=1 Tax=Plakobranchus ocellatus TaxID=259542 RepID=A0AAV4ABY9_9GAST|nr:mannose-binding protein c [Plakobranchus ocellatus]
MFCIFICIQCSRQFVSSDTNYHISHPREGSKYLISKQDEIFDLAKMNGRCQDSGGSLLDFNDRKEEFHVRFFVQWSGVSDVIYTGITDLGNEGHYYSYATGKPAAYIRWKRGQPDNREGDEHCLSIGSRGLEDVSCHKNGRYICKIPA